MKEHECGIVRDLLPLYADGLASAESEALILAHIEACPTCRAELERMRTALVQENAAQNADWQKALRIQLRHMRRTNICAALLGILAAAALILLALWWSGIFDIAERQVSPDGQTITTAYRRDVSNMLHPVQGFSLNTRSAGALFPNIKTVYGGTYAGMWWSYDSQYLLLAAKTEEGTRLTIARGSNMELNWYLSEVTDAFPDLFPALSSEEDDALTYEFVQWGSDSHAMLFRYSYIGTDGIDRAGYFWFDLDTWAFSGATALPRESVRGQISALSDETLELTLRSGETSLFSLTSVTDVRNTQALKTGDYVLLVYQPDPTQETQTALSVTRTTKDAFLSAETPAS